MTVLEREIDERGWDGVLYELMHIAQNAEEKTEGSYEASLLYPISGHLARATEIACDLEANRRFVEENIREIAEKEK